MDIYQELGIDFDEYWRDYLARQDLPRKWQLREILVMLHIALVDKVRGSQHKLTETEHLQRAYELLHRGWHT